jgi:hypothetical protein
MTNPKYMATAAVLCSLMTSANSTAQITDPEEMKSWLFLQKLATEIEELERCQIIELTEASYSPRYQTVVNEKAAVFVHEADAFIQRFPTRSTTETPEAYRLRVWSSIIDFGKRHARPFGKLTLSLCRTLLPP